VGEKGKREKGEKVGHLSGIRLLKTQLFCHPERSEGSHLSKNARFFAPLRMTSWRNFGFSWLGDVMARQAVLGIGKAPVAEPGNQKIPRDQLKVRLKRHLTDLIEF
jgi:hypothetical protein